MNLTAKQIAELVNGRVMGNEKTSVSGVAPLQEATPNDLAFLNDPKYLKNLASSQARIVLIKSENEKEAKNLNNTFILVENPQFAFSKILTLIAKEKEETAGGIHPTAIISPNAKISSGVSIGPYTVIEDGGTVGEGSKVGAQCYIGKKAQVGRNCKVYPQVTIREEVIIRDRVIVHSGSVIGSDGFGYVTIDKTHQKIPQIGTVEIHDDVEIGANVTVDRATIGKTVIGKGSKIDNLVQIAHNVQIGEGCVIVAQAGVAGSSQLGRFVTLAGQVGVVGHIKIGDGAIAAAQSGIPNDVPEGAIVFGSPARPIREERKIQAIIGKLPEIYQEFRKIKKALRIDE